MCLHEKAEEQYQTSWIAATSTINSLLGTGEQTPWTENFMVVNKQRGVFVTKSTIFLSPSSTQQSFWQINPVGNRGETGANLILNQVLILAKLLFIAAVN